jgi:hypothetical protein
VCWREAISSLHIPVGVKCFEEIASPDCHQARNDAGGVFARNDAKDAGSPYQCGCSIALTQQNVVNCRSKSR